MKKTNKFLSILLATILILSLFPVSLAHASDNTVTFSAETDVVSAKAGDIVNVDICMSENSVVAALTLIVNYDNTALKILNVQSKEAFGYEEFNTAYGNNKLAYLTASANPKTVGGTLFTIQFEMLKEGCTEISLSVKELADIDLILLSSSTQSAKIHNFDNGTVTQPTCTEQGYTTYACACGYLNGVVENYVDATGHSHIPEITTPATHLAEGVMTYTCHCGDSYTEAIKKIAEHSHETTVTPPTCTEQGFTTYTCECGDTYVDDYVDALGHKYESEITIPVTHLAEGLMTYTCHCGDSYTEAIKKIAEHNHETAVSAPTCTEQGFTTYTCECGDTYVDDYVDALGHKYESEITIPATHLAEGLMTYTCHCGDSYTEAIKKIAEHNHETVVTAPTCTEQGFTTYTCECGDTYIDDYVNANGHDYNSVVTAPTCTETGFTTYTCTCGDTYVGDETPATGHLFSNGSCTVCGETDPDYYVFSVKEPSRTTIRNKDGIILQTEITGNTPEGSYVEWTATNSNFNKTVMNDGQSLRVIANNKGYTTFTATLYDVNGNALATDNVELYSQSGFFDKIGGFFRSLFGMTKIYEN